MVAWLVPIKNLNSSHDLTTPLTGMICHPWAWLTITRTTINIPTKFELSIPTHYEDMKGDTKYRKWGGLG